MSREYVFTSESVASGHPDKVCDLVADSIVDAYLEGDPASRIGCEALLKGDFMVVAGEVTSAASVDHDAVTRSAITEAGYGPGAGPHTVETIERTFLITEQGREIRRASMAKPAKAAGASDQGIVFGFACADTPELLPLPIALSHRIAARLGAARAAHDPPWLLPDGKTAVSVVYDGTRPVRLANVVVAQQHRPDVTRDDVDAYVRALLPEVIGDWLDDEVAVLVNRGGSFTEGGPAIDCGVTGRKLAVDTYGGLGRHGGGALSGKDPSKLDRSAAYFARWVARQVVQERLAARVELQVAYVIGDADPISIRADAFGSGGEARILRFVREFDFRPAAIVERLQLDRPIYRRTAVYGHFGKPDLPWERP